MEDSLTVVLAGVALGVQLMPRLGEVRRAGRDSATGRDVETGLAMSTATLVGVGLLVGASARSWRPVALTSAAAALIALIYLTALRQRGEPLPPPAPTGGVARWGVTNGPNA